MTEEGFSGTMLAVLLLTHSLHRVNLGLQLVPTGPLYQYPKYVYIKSTTVYVPSSELGLSHLAPPSPASVPLPRN
jgi:hypothetical protein